MAAHALPSARISEAPGAALDVKESPAADDDHARHALRGLHGRAISKLLTVAAAERTCLQNRRSQRDQRDDERAHVSIMKGALASSLKSKSLPCALERPFQVNRLETRRPIDHVVAGWLRCLFAGPQSRSVLRREELEPSDPDVSSSFGGSSDPVLAAVAPRSGVRELMNVIGHAHALSSNSDPRQLDAERSPISPPNRSVRQLTQPNNKSIFTRRRGEAEKTFASSRERRAR